MSTPLPELATKLHLAVYGYLRQHPSRSDLERAAWLLRNFSDILMAVADSKSYEHPPNPPVSPQVFPGPPPLLRQMAVAMVPEEVVSEGEE